MLGEKNRFRAEDPIARSLEAYALDAAGRAEEKLGSSGPLDSWRRAAVFDVSGQRAPFAVEIVAEQELYDTSFDELAAGLLWDDASALAHPPVSLNAGMKGDAPSRAILYVSDVKGQKLELWTSGFDVLASARIVSKAEGDNLARLAAAEAGQPKQSPVDALFKGAGAVVAVVAVLVVGALVLRARGA